MSVAVTEAYAATTKVDGESSWRAIAPESNLRWRSLTTVGLTWEANNIGGNPKPAYDDSDGDGSTDLGFILLSGNRNDCGSSAY